jgi:thioredoxin reductase (NADPH)
MARQDLHSVAFPVLDDTQIDALAGCSAASLKRYPDGHVLIKVGDPHFKFFVVKSGSIEILDESGDTPRRVTLHGKGQPPTGFPSRGSTWKPTPRWTSS